MESKYFDIDGPILISPKVFIDERGFFCERYRFDQFKAIGISTHFIQDNFSRSTHGTLRGLHYQWETPQSKLVTCARGRILDVAVDIRASSPTFGKHITAVLSGDKPEWLWIPAGFAHGFLVLSDEGADLSYKVDALWNNKGEGCIAWNDSELKIPWGVQSGFLSEKDQKGISFTDYAINPKF
jgi:dTDP-4-dehydrorhamnose 3,5-epimerase